MKILITGGARGIGKAIYDTLSKEHEVYITSRNEQKLKEINPKKYCVCDLGVNIEPLIEFIRENEFDIVINNAGDYKYGGIETMSAQVIDTIYKINLISPAKIISAAVPYMKKKNFGRIINIGSISGVMGEANASLYSASKAGLIGATKALALELAEHGITVNTINPGWVDTELGNKSIEDSEFSREEIIECIPQKRFVSPEEVAGLVKYLISEEAKGITGQSINICAGLSVGY